MSVGAIRVGVVGIGTVDAIGYGAICAVHVKELRTGATRVGAAAG